MPNHMHRGIPNLLPQEENWCTVSPILVIWVFTVQLYTTTDLWWSIWNGEYSFNSLWYWVWVYYATPSLHNYYMEPWVSDPTDNIAVSASKTLALLALPIWDAHQMTALMRMNFIIIRKWLHITSVCLLIQLQLLMLRLYNWNHLCAYVVSGEWQTWWQLCIYNLEATEYAIWSCFS